jgi:DNA (cytosine-5)-methyltransferase 1
MLLSLFPGVGLLDTAFERAGFQIVRGPDLIWGGDVRRFHVNGDYFCGIIGGPPCQVHSTASKVGPGTKAVDLINHFVRLALEASPYDVDFSFSACKGVYPKDGKPTPLGAVCTLCKQTERNHLSERPFFVAMENVPAAHKSRYIPKAWHNVVLRDWDCGGQTSRKRRIWTYPFTLQVPPKREGKPSHSVMATTYKRGKSTNPFVTAKSYLPGDLKLEDYGKLQGCQDLVRGLSKYNFSRSTIIQLIGNGVPLAMGEHVARAAKAYMDFMEN